MCYLDADAGDDIAGLGLFDILSPQPIERLHLCDLTLDDAAIALDDGKLLAGLDLAVVKPADTDSTDVIVVKDAGDLQLQGFLGITMRSAPLLLARNGSWWT